MKVAIAGNGPAARRHVIETVETAMEAGDSLVLFLDPETSDRTQTAPRFVADWAKSNNIDFTLIVGSDGDRSEYVEELMESYESFPGTNVCHHLGPQDVLYLAWEDDDDHCERALMTGTRRGVRVYDLTHNNDQLVYEADEVDTAPYEIEIDATDVASRIAAVLERAREEIAQIVAESVPVSA